MNTNNRYTPATITTEDLRFSIPLYQRLFAWGDKEVLRLLYDLKEYFEKTSLKEHSEKTSVEPYYLGMLTMVRNGQHFDLVDGQQRFTVLTLMGVVFAKEYQSEEWKTFLDNGNRLVFSGRTDDYEYIVAKIEGKESVGYTNERMENALACVKNFMAKHFANDVERASQFIHNVYDSTTIFSTELPKNYLDNPSSLNKYFEAMNATGKSLEQYEILKVEMLRNQNDQVYLTNIWNAVSQMDKPLIKRREDMREDEYRAKYLEAIRLCKNKQYRECYTHVEINNDSDSDDYTTIAEIRPEKKKFNKDVNQEGTESIIKFSEFLLLVLDIVENKLGGYSYYRADKLQENFSPFPKDVKGFYENLLYYRLLLDFYVVHKKYESGNSSYKLIYKDNDSEMSACLKQYQGMLDVYHTSSFYLWLKDYLWFIDREEYVSSQTLLHFLKAKDNERHSSVPALDELFYPHNESDEKSKLDRYWFWRLDYYLWENRKEIFKQFDNVNHESINQYDFKSNRSIEHLHPQDQTENTPWESGDIHSFGNLAMISQSFNSTQSNDHVHVKFSRVEEQVERKMLQSLKLYHMYLMAKANEKEWDITCKNNHSQTMYQLLLDSYKE